MSSFFFFFFFAALHSWPKGFNNTVTTLRSCSEEPGFIFSRSTGCSSARPVEHSREDEAWCFKVVLFVLGVRAACDSGAGQRDWWFVCLFLSLLSVKDHSHSHSLCWRCIHCLQKAHTRSAVGICTTWTEFAQWDCRSFQFVGGSFSVKQMGRTLEDF